MQAKDLHASSQSGSGESCDSHVMSNTAAACRGCEFGDVCALSPLPLSDDSPLPSLPDQSDCSVVDQPRLGTQAVKTFLQEHQKNRYII